jgi:recombination protein RecR
MFSPLIEQLITALSYLPNVGPKTAQRMALYLLERDRHKGQKLAQALQEAMTHIGHCQSCRTWSETQLCQLCRNPNRDATKLCIVETPSDLLAIEQTGIFKGYYFVLMGHLSPLDGIGPLEIGAPQLYERVKQSSIQEIIIAINHSIEGDITTHYIVELLKPLSITITQIAHGIPLGSDIEFIDAKTLADALKYRVDIKTG